MNDIGRYVGVIIALVAVHVLYTTASPEQFQWFIYGVATISAPTMLLDALQGLSQLLERSARRNPSGWVARLDNWATVPSERRWIDEEYRR